MPGLRILILSTATGYGGAERSMEILIPELARRAEITVMTGNPRHRHNLGLAAAPAGGQFRLLPLPYREDRKYTAVALLAYLVTWVLLRPDVVVANTERAAGLVASAGRRWPWAGRGAWVYVRDFRWRSLPAVLANLPTAGVLVPGPAVMEEPGYLAPWVGSPGGRPLRIVPDMVEAIDEGEPTMGGPVLHLATVNPFKGHGHLIRAAERLRRVGRRLPVRSRGFTELPGLRRELERQIAAAGIGGPGGFELLDAVESPAAELRHCSCVVVTSTVAGGGPETFGRSIIEAWSHGRPVVAFAVGGPRHLIEHGVDGLLVPEGDVEALAEALWRLFTDPSLLRRLGAAGREKVRRYYAKDVVADRFLAVVGADGEESQRAAVI